MKNIIRLSFSIIFLLPSCTNTKADVIEEFDKGKNHSKNNEYTKAIDVFTGIIELTDTCLNCYLERGHAYRAIKEPVKARKDYNEIISTGNDTEIKVAYVNRGGTYYDELNYDKALMDYLTALKFEPKNGLILNMVAHMYFATNNKEKGCEYYWESIKYLETDFNPEIPDYCDSLRIELQKD